MGLCHLVLSVGSNSNASSLDTSLCGVNFCLYDNLAIPPDDNSSANAASLVEEASQLGEVTNVQLLNGILLGIGMLATGIMVIFVDPAKALESSTDVIEGASHQSAWRMLIDTFQQMKNPYQLLIIPLTIWTGSSMAFGLADFTYVSSITPSLHG